MGRNVSGGSASGLPSREVAVVRSSTPALQVPAWARGGYMLVSGIGGGGGAGEHSRAAAGAYSVDYFIPLPAEADYLQVEIGAGGRPSPLEPHASANGGATRLVIDNVEVLRLAGGSAAAEQMAPASGVAGRMNEPYFNTETQTAVTNLYLLRVMRSWNSWQKRRGFGLFDGEPAQIYPEPNDGQVRRTNDNASSPFGGIVGGKAFGYGYGGSGISNLRDGGDGIMIINFMGVREA